jgi:hypothetical protein
LGKVGNGFALLLFKLEIKMSEVFYRIRIPNSLKLDMKHRRILVQRVKDQTSESIFEKTWRDKSAALREVNKISKNTGVHLEVGEYQKAMSPW